jgi:hypothetical protein
MMMDLLLSMLVVNLGRVQDATLTKSSALSAVTPGISQISVPTEEEQQEQGTNLCMNGTEETQVGASGFSFSQSTAQDIPATWVLLDNQSMIDLFCNAKLLKNIHHSNMGMNI